jgi:hypothetical protein
MINNLLNDPNYTAEQKVQLMQLMNDKALDKALMYLDEDKNDKQNKN